MNLDRKWKKGFETAKIFEIVRLFYIKHSKPKKTTKITKFRNWSLECPLAVVCCLQLVVGHVLLVVSKIWFFTKRTKWVKMNTNQLKRFDFDSGLKKRFEPIDWITPAPSPIHLPHRRRRHRHAPKSKFRIYYTKPRMILAGRIFVGYNWKMFEWFETHVQFAGSESSDSFWHWLKDGDSHFRKHQISWISSIQVENLKPLWG